MHKCYVGASAGTELTRTDR